MLKCICTEDEIMLMQSGMFNTNDDFPIEKQFAEVGNEIAFHL